MVSVEEALRRLIDGAKGGIITITSTDVYKMMVNSDVDVLPPRLAEAIYATVMAIASDCVLREEDKVVRRGSRRHTLWLSVPCLRQILLSI